MNKEIILNKKDESKVKAVIKFLDIDYIDKILGLEKSIYDGLDNKDFYCCSSREEFTNALLKNGKIIGCVIPESDELIAIGVYVSYGENEHNYGYDFNIVGEELYKVGQIESTIVNSDYRGNGLQKLMCTILEDVAKDNGNTIISATAAPDNKYSVDTFIKLGYKIMADKFKYGGLRRYVFMKSID